MVRVLFGVFALAATGCTIEGDDPLDGPCQEYCEQRNVCDGDVDIESCRQDCVDAAQDCQADEKEEALDDIDACADESCDEIAACTVGAGLQCYLGI